MKKVKEAHKVTKEKESETRVLGSKITKCERACGCDKKKIRFKHSYVKIKVTSPDISSLCPCPDECIPGVKGGVFVDNQGVNVIIESAVGIPQYKLSSNGMSETSGHDHRINNLKPFPIFYDIQHKNRNLIRSIYDDNTLNYRNSHSQDSLLDTQFTHIPLANKRYYKTRTLYRQYGPNLVIYNSCNKICSIGKFESHSLETNPGYEAANFITYVSNHLSVTASSSRDSFDSIKIIHSEISLSFSSTYEEVSSSSVISFAASVSTLNSNAYQLSLSNIVFNGSAVVESECLTNGVECCAIDSNRSKVDIEYQASAVKNTLIKRKQMPDDVFEVFPMSSTNPSSVNETKNNSTYKDNVGEPVIIITNLNSNLDLTSVVDELITKKEFSEASSLFVVVPTSDEEENEIRVLGLGSTQCVQLSENCNNWQNAQDTQPCTTCRRTSSKTQDLRTTEKPKLILKNVPTTVLSSISNGRTMYYYVENGRNWVPRNQICHIITPNAMFQDYPGVSTDTTQDRPCCCGQVGPCANVMSEVIPPVCIKQGLESKTFSVHRITKIPQASCVSIIRSPALSVNRMAESHRHPGAQSPEQILQYPFETPMPRHLKYFKKLLQRTLSPHTMNKILRELDSGQLDRSSLDESNGSPSEFSPEESLLSNSSVTPINENYFICHQQKFKKGKLPKWAIKSKKTVRIDAACDCQHHLPSFIKTETDSKTANDYLGVQHCNEIPKRIKYSAVSKLGHKVTGSIVRPGALVSIGVQDSPRCILCLSGLPCTSEHNISDRMTSLSNVMSHRTLVDIYGHTNQQNSLSPLRSYAAIGSGGIYTQSGSKHLPHRMNAGVGVDLKNASTDKYRSTHSNKQIQKNKPFSRYMPRDYERRQNNIILMKPNLTQTTSRVQFDEKSLVKPLVKPSWTIEDLIRYYATFKPEVLKTLLSLTSVKTPDERDITNNKERFIHGSIKGESSGLTYLHESSDVPVKEAREQENRAFTGFKIKKPGLNVGDLSTEKKNMTQQVSALLTSTISRCEIVPCDGRNSCHTPDQILQFPFGTPLSEPLEKLKKLVQLNCSPEKVKHFFEQIEAGNVKDIDLEFEEAMKAEEDIKTDEATNMKTDDSPTTESDLVRTTKPNCRVPSCTGHPGCHSVDEVLQYPFGTPLPPNLVKLKELLEQKCSPKKVKFLFDQIEAGNLKNIDWHASVEIATDSPVDLSPSINTVPRPTSNCRLPPCHGHPGCHPPDEILQYPYGTLLSPELTELKKLIEQNDCPEKVKKLYAQITSGNLKNVHWKEDPKFPADCPPNTQAPSISVPTSQTKSKLPPFQERQRYLSPDKTLQSLSGAPQKLKGFKEVIGQRDSPDKVKYLIREGNAGNRNNVEIQKLVVSTDLQSDDHPLSVSTPAAITHKFKPYEKYPESPHSSLPTRDELGNSLEDNCNLKKNDHLFDSDFMSNNCSTLKSIPTTSTCILSSCHSPDEVSRYPYATALPPHLIRLKELLEENSNPQRVKELFQEIEAGHFKSDFKTPCSDPPCQKNKSYSTGCHLPDEVMQYPYGVPLSHSLENLKKIIERNGCPKKVKKLFRQIQDGDNVCNLDWAGALDSCTENYSDNNSTCRNPNCEKKRHYGNQGYMSNVPCPEPACQKNTGCHLPDEVLQYPFGVPLSHSLENLKKVIERNGCPKKVKKLFRQIQDGENVCNLDWAGALNDSTEYYSDNNSTCRNPNCENKRRNSNQGYMSNGPCPEPSCQKNTGCHLPDEVLQYPFGVPLSHSLEKLKKIIEHNGCPKKVKKLYKQIQDGDSVCNLDWNGASNNCTEFYPKKCSTSGVKPCRNPTCDKNRRSLKTPCREPTCPQQTCCDLLDEGTPSPSGIPLSQSLENLRKLIQRNRKQKKVKKCCKQIHNNNDNVCNLDFEGVKPCRTPTCEKKRTCRNSSCPKNTCSHLPDEDECPPTASLSKSIENLKKLIERNRNSKKKKKCCKQKQNSDNTCHNPDCERALDSPSECYPENYYSTSKQNSCRNPCCKKKNRYSDQDSKPKLPCPDPTCQKQTSCHLPDELLQLPFGTPLPHSLENLKKIIERDGCPKKVKKLYKQIQNNDSYCKLDWKGAMDTCSLYDPDDFESPKVIPCRTPTCQKSPGCHLAGEIIQYPYNTPLPQQLIKLKMFLEQNSNPKEVMDLFGQIEAGNLKNLDWVQALQALSDFSPGNSPNSELISPTISTCHIPVCQGHPSCHLPDEILQYPFGTPLPEHLVKLKNLIEQNNDPNKVKELFRQLEIGNMKDLDWDGAYETHPHQDCQESHSIDERSFETPLQPLPMVEMKNLIEDICNPGTVQQLIKQIEACNLNNMKSVGCGENTAIPVSIATDSMSLHMPPERTPESILLKADTFSPESILLKPGAFPPGAPPMIFPPGASPMICPPGAPTSDVCAPGVSPRLLLPPTIPIVLPPEVYAPAPKDEDCDACHKPKYRDGVKMKCACKGKKKIVKKKPCPCELHKVPISKEQSGLKIATHSKPAQCCICDDYFAGVKKSGKDVIFKLGQSAPSIIGTPGGPVSTGVQGGTGCIICPTGLPCSSDHTTCPKLTTITISPIPMGYYGQPDAQTLMGELEIIGPQGGYVIIGPDGISTQSGIKVIKFSTGTGTDPDSDNVGAESTSKKKKNCLCFGKKKRKITCQCPPETESEVEPLLLYTYEDFEEARKLSKQYKSDLTQTTSGFKFDKKKRPPAEPKPEYTVEDAIRDYAIIKPDFIRSLVPRGVRRKNKVDCACEEDVGVGSYEILKKNAKGGWEYENPEPVPPPLDVPLKGLKFSIGGKGSGSKGLTGICCFEMYQDS
ncbi:unnamed protein product [Arctia plantaginis]|uniref:Uncharacterized protein n=1 Tax=Arctia plantaginis TaxID=874455 RepID=A0A8S0Z1X5_ARCPL|nr:unnamed protein product [Arctia plantaginis]